jgi:hypothetical protein
VAGDAMRMVLQVQNERFILNDETSVCIATRDSQAPLLNMPPRNSKQTRTRTLMESLPERNINRVSFKHPLSIKEEPAGSHIVKKQKDPTST